MSSPASLVLETVTGPDVLGEVHQALERTWAQHHDVPDSVRIRMATAVAEIGANIVQYAGSGRPVKLRMEIEVVAHQVTIIFIDDGMPAAVDLDAVSLPDVEAKQGRGLALAAAVLDTLSYDRDDPVNRWTLVSQPFD